MKAKKFLVPFIWLSIALFTFNSCKKETTEPDKPAVNQPNAVKLSTAFTDVKNYQVIVIGVSGKKLDQEKYSATLGDTTVTMAKLSDSTLTVMIPANVSGKNELKADFAGNSILLTITALPAIQDPDAVVKQFTNTIPAELDKIESFLDTSAAGQNLDKAAIKRDFDEIRKIYQHQLAAYNALSEEDKLVCASFLLSNKDIIERMQASTLELMTNLGMKKKAGCLSEALRLNAINCQTEKLMDEVILLGAGSTIGLATGAIIGGPLGIVTAGIIVGLVADKQYYAIIAAWEDLASQKWSLVNVSNWAFNKKSGVEFNNGEMRAMVFEVEIRNIQPSDAGKGSVAGKMLSLRANIQEAGSFLKMKIFPGFKPQVISKTKPEALNYISLETDNAKVSGKITGTPDNLQISFSTTATEEQNFNFVIVYNDGESTVKSQSIAAKLNVIKWTLTDQNLNSDDHQIDFEIIAPGDVTWTITAPTEWIFSTLKSGKGSEPHLQLAVQNNIDLTSRTGNVTLSAGGKTFTIKVTQEASTDKLAFLRSKTWKLTNGPISVGPLGTVTDATLSFKLEADGRTSAVEFVNGMKSPTVSRSQTLTYPDVKLSGNTFVAKVDQSYGDYYWIIGPGSGKNGTITSLTANELVISSAYGYTYKFKPE